MFEFLLTESVTDLLLFKLSERIGRDWEGLAYNLGFKEYEVSGFKGTNDKANAKAMLSAWKRDDGKRKGATKKILASALDDTGLALLAVFVRKF